MGIRAHDEMRPQPHAMREIEREQRFEASLLLRVREARERSQRTLFVGVNHRPINGGAGDVNESLRSRGMSGLEKPVNGTYAQFGGILGGRVPGESAGSDVDERVVALENSCGARIRQLRFDAAKLRMCEARSARIHSCHRLNIRALAEHRQQRGRE